MIRIERRPRALEDLRDHATFIARDNLGAAEEFLRCAEQTFRELSMFPRQGRVRTDLPRPLSSLRSVRVHRHPNYIVYYKVASKTLAIVRLLHAAQDVESTLSK
jgi:plasmid stabilization system protein ParE